MQSGGDDLSFDGTPAASYYRPVPTMSDWHDVNIDESSLVAEFSQFQEAKGHVSPPVVAEVITRLARQAAAESVALEEFYQLQPGESRSIAISQEGWEAILTDEAGQNIGLFESQLNAFRHVLDVPAYSQSVAESFIRELHAIACKSQGSYKVHVDGASGTLIPQDRPLRHGQYKEYPNNVTRRDGTTHWYAPVTDIVAEMERFAEQLGSEDFAQAHPLVQAAYAHYGLVHIHPFADGNGRTARTLASLYVYRAYGVPLVVYSDRKLTYIQALEIASQSEYQDAVDQIRDRVTDTLAHARQELMSLTRQNSEERLRAFVTSISTYTDLSIDEMRKIGENVASVVANKVARKAAQLKMIGSEQQLSWQCVDVESDGTSRTAFDGSDPYVGVRACIVELGLLRPVKVSTRMYFLTGVASEFSLPFPFSVVVATNAPAYRQYVIEQVRFRFEDCVPKISISAHDRLDLLIETAWQPMLDELTSEMQKILRQAGRLIE